MLLRPLRKTVVTREQNVNGEFLVSFGSTPEHCQGKGEREREGEQTDKASTRLTEVPMVRE